MGAAARLGGFVVALALVFGGAWWVGTGVPGVLVPPATASDEHADEVPSNPALEIGSPGLVSASARYSLVARGITTFKPRVPSELAFVVIGPGGLPVTAFDTKDER